MNGYEMLSNSYRKMLDREDTTEEERKDIEQEIKVLDFLATCSDYEICKLFDSSAFNEITKGYIELACNNIETEDKQRILNEVNMLFSEKQALEVLRATNRIWE